MFCKEIEQKLLNKEIDIAVHSLKDLDSLETKGLVIQAFIKEMILEMLLFSKKLKNFFVSSTAIIGSSSRRRELQIKLLNNNLKIKNIRGNVDTRIKKIDQGEYDGVVLAMAGLKSLNLDARVKKDFFYQRILANSWSRSHRSTM